MTFADDIKTRFGIAGAPANALATHYDYIAQIEMATPQELNALEGVGRTTVKQIRAVQAEIEKSRRPDPEPEPVAAQLPPRPDDLPPALVRTGNVVHARSNSEDARELARYEGGLRLTVCDTVGLIIDAPFIDIQARDRTCRACRRGADPAAAQMLEMVDEVIEFERLAREAAYDEGAERLFG